MSTRIDELRSELNASKRDEKDLRSKEVCFSPSHTRVTLYLYTFAADIHEPDLSAGERNRQAYKVPRIFSLHLMPTYRSSTLSSAVSSANSSLISEPHSGLSGASEKYRHDLRQREETIRNLKRLVRCMKWRL